MAKAWKFFSSPQNLSGITPPDLGFKEISDIPEGSIYEGMTIEYKVSPVGGIPVRWRTVITQVEEGRSFTDFQQKGPYKLWKHFHEFIPNKQGVLMIDRVDYELPLGLLGSIAYWLFVRKKLNGIFDYRYSMLERLFNSQGFAK